MEGKQGSRLVIKEIDHQTMEMVLHFIYTGSVRISGASQLLKLYQAGDRLDIDRLCKLCLHEARCWLCFSTCIDILIGSWLFGLMDLHSYCERFVLQNFEAVSFFLLAVWW